MKLRILALAVCIICSMNLIGQEQFDRLYRTNQRIMTSLDMVEQEGGGTYFLLSKYFKETNRDTVHGLNVTSLDKKGSVNWSRDYIFYEDSSAVETIGSIVITREGMMINAVVVDTLANLSNVMVGLGPTGIMQYARSYGNNSEDLIVGNAILSNALDPFEVFHFGNSMTEDGVGLYASKLDLEGAVIWAADLQAKDTLDNEFEEEIEDLAINFDSTYLAVGTLDDESIFVLNHDENGGQLYSNSFRTIGNFRSEASGVATLDDSTTVISAYITNDRGNTTGGLIKLDTLGNLIWGKQLTATLGLGSITINDVVAGVNGQFAVAGNIEGPDVLGGISDGEFIIVMDSIGRVVAQSQYQIIGGKGSLRSGSLASTEDDGYAYLTTAFDDMGAGDDTLMMRMIKVDNVTDLEMLENGENCNSPLERLMIDDLSFTQDTLVWGATLIENGVDTIEVNDFNYSHQAPILSLQDSMFCPGDPVMFEFDATTPGAVSYRWYDAEDENTTLSIDSVFVGTELDVDYVAVVKIELDNCFTLCDTSRLTEITPPMLQVGKSPSDPCGDNQVLLRLDGADGLATEWSTSETTSQILVSEPGTYDVTVIDDCGDPQSTSIAVVDSDFYQEGALEDSGTGDCSGGSLRVFVETSGDVASVNWDTGGSGNSILVTEAGTYTATITDVCGVEIVQSIDVAPEQLFECFEGDCEEGMTTTIANGCLCWPNAFVPSSNEESNMQFGPNNLCPNVISNYNLRIYNRWGEKVFESEAVGSEWNGNRGSKRAPSAVYAFYVSYDVEGVTLKDKGHVTLIR